MLPGLSIHPGSTTQLVPYIPYGGDWTDKEQLNPGTVIKKRQLTNILGFQKAVKFA